MNGFIDPRSAKTPETTQCVTTSNRGEIEDLLRLCREGKLYEVETWIRAGRPIQLSANVSPRRATTSPLEIAIESGNHSLALLLLANGYDPDAEDVSPLDQALEDRRWDLVDLLLDWRADPRRVALESLFGTYRTDLFERFAAAGVDFAEGHALAYALAEHTSNKPLYGFTKRHRGDNSRIQSELNSALVDLAANGNAKGVHLCLWAGANPHAPARSLRYAVGNDDDVQDDGSGEADLDDGRFIGFSAIYEACSGGHVEILRRLRPDPAEDDFDDLYCTARNTAVLRILVEIKPPDDPERVIRSCLTRLGWSFSAWESLYLLEELFRIGLRMRAFDPDTVAAMRRTMLKLPRETFVRVMKILATGDNCSPEFLAELARTPAFRAKMQEVGFLPLEAKSSRRWRDQPPTRSREIVRKCGIEVKKERAPLPSTVYIGQWAYGSTDLKLERADLYELVWSRPVSKLAAEWGLSDRGLGKALARLQVPVPPRGYWARLAAGRRVRRPALPALPKGEAGQVVIVRPPPAVRGHMDAGQ